MEPILFQRSKRWTQCTVSKGISSETDAHVCLSGYTEDSTWFFQEGNTFPLKPQDSPSPLGPTVTCRDGTCVHHPGYCQDWPVGEWVTLAGHCVTGGNFQQIRYPAVISLCFLMTLVQQLPVLRYVISGQDLILAFVATSSLILTWSVQVAMSFGKTRPDLTTTDTDVQ